MHIKQPFQDKPLLLLESGVNTYAGKVARHQELIQFDRPGDRLDKYDDLDPRKSLKRRRSEKTYLVEL